MICELTTFLATTECSAQWTFTIKIIA